MRDQYGVQPLYFFTQALDAKLWRCVHDQFDFGRFNVDGGPRAPVLRVRQIFRRIFQADERHALGSASAKKCETK